MDEIRMLVKDVLHKIQDIPDIPFNAVKMSEVASENWLSAPTSTSDSLDSVATPNSHSDGDTPVEGTQKLSPKLTMRKSASISNHLGSLHVSSKQSFESVISDSNSAPVLSREDKPLPARIIMGKRDLLRSRSTELKSEEAVVVHELALSTLSSSTAGNLEGLNASSGGFCNMLTLHTSLQRGIFFRMSKESRSTDDDGTSSNYSAGSAKEPEGVSDGSNSFPPESDDLNLINSAENLPKETSNNSTLSCIESNEKEFDSKVFLQEALGDMFSDSQYTVSTMKSSKLQHSISVDPVSGGGSLISRAGTVYNSMRRSLRRACSFREATAEDNATIRSQVRCQSYSPQHFTSVENLMRDLYVQNGIIFQVSKALTFCRKSKDVTSTEYIEAEKILLVASCQKEATQAALDLLQFGDKPNENYPHSGTLQISDLAFQLRKDHASEEEPAKKFEEYFVVLLTSGKTVLASQVLLADHTGVIKSEKHFEFTGLHTDFEVNVSIYSMQVKCGHSTDGKHPKKERSLLSPYAKILFHLNSHKSSRRNLQVDNVSSIKPSSFTLWGSCVMCCADIQKTHFRLHHVSLQSSLDGQFTAALKGDVKLSNRMGGFLTIGFEDKTPLVWNRRWCVLSGHLLKYWNYPSEEFNSHPVGVIDLSRAAAQATSAVRSVCPRPKSLLLQIQSREQSVLAYFLTADTLEDKERWKTDINFVIETLECWNCLRGNELVSSL
ncbi:anillin-like isoform X3 [Dendroctonus ponderosae]|uniref:anillin isoform X3 n=1 Tax=Dendroctonus ponderosae TaxID=77166 RepID=UPI002035ECA5|nr:anillin isoform X3 [Dendroctonus ponderosae]XP_048518244.1 anillin-like isoform X3 [Dendroctonus ponderosae]